MNSIRRMLIGLLFLMGTTILASQVDDSKQPRDKPILPVVLDNHVLKLMWGMDDNGEYRLQSIGLNHDSGEKFITVVDGFHSVLFSDTNCRTHYLYLYCQRD